jgi:hypothetical protein
MTLQQRASKSWAKTSRTAALPPWTNLLGGVLLVVLILGLIVHAGSHTTPLATIASNVPITSPSNTTKTTLATPASSSILTTSGTVTHVPAAALRVGEAAARAVYSGNLNGLALTPSAIYTAPGVYYPSPKLSRPRLQAATSSSLTFSFSVLPHPGLTVMQQVVTVTNVNGPWQWTGEAG